MTWATVGSLQFLWWNTSLSPPVKTLKERALPDQIDFVISQIKAIRASYGNHLIGLGEVSENNVRAILEGLGDRYLSGIKFASESKRAINDTALIYDRRSLLHISKRSFETLHGGRTLKVGDSVSFEVTANQDLIHVVTSHWPSNMRHGSDSQRIQMASDLYRSIGNLSGRRDSYVVLMGDFNDDPFSTSLTSHLLATRDRQLARKKAEFFYNPFWRWIGESLHDDVVGDETSICGTHFYRSGKHSRWSTYDQIIFSSAFLRDQSAVLNEQRTAIVATSELRAKVRERSHFDHFPIVSSIDLRKKQ